MPKTVIVDIRNMNFPPVSIVKNTFVVWRNLDPVVHSAETMPDSPYYFNAGALFPGEASSPVLFASPGSFEYICRYHAEMSGTITVGDQTSTRATPMKSGMDDSGMGEHGGHSHFQHYHGFVTGGRTGQRLFMTHTPVIADDRHRYQIILQGRLVEQSHIDAYNSLRNSAFGDGQVQIFHDHISLLDISNGTITTLPEASFEYYPDGKPDGIPVPGLEEKIPVHVDKVLHFHQFDPDMDYPDGLPYLIYGDMDDIFIDSFITRAPNFHSVAKLAKRPPFWTNECLGKTLKIVVPSKRIIDVSPKLVQRVAFVDNSFHVFWLLPPGAYGVQAQDPLIRRDKTPAVYDVLLEDGSSRGTIEIGKFLHFDVRLLNYGVLITP